MSQQVRPLFWQRCRSVISYRRPWTMFLNCMRFLAKNHKKSNKMFSSLQLQCEQLYLWLVQRPQYICIYCGMCILWWSPNCSNLGKKIRYEVSQVKMWFQQLHIEYFAARIYLDDLVNMTTSRHAKWTNGLRLSSSALKTDVFLIKITPNSSKVL